AEIARLALRRGANPLTLAGLAGVGDLVLTCTGHASRNRTVGFELGKGRSLADVLGGMKMVAEGVRTARSARDLARRYDVDMPITNAVASILHDGVSVRDAISDLLGREMRSERD